jgi:hypothetical protein
MKRLFLLWIVLMMGVGGAFAQGGDDDLPIAPLPAPNFPLVLQAIQDNPDPLMLNLQAAQFGAGGQYFAPNSPACTYAAASYLQEDVTAIRVNQVEIDSIPNGNADPEVVYTLLYILLETQFEPMVSLVYPQVGGDVDVNITPQVALGQTMTIVGQMTCLLDDDGMVGRFWQVEVDGISGFMLETLSWVEPIDLSAFWDVQEASDPANDLNAPDLPILAEGVTLRLLKPYVEVEPTTVNSASEIQAGDSYPTYCEHGAPSRLAVGMQAEMAGPTSMRFPNGQGIAADGADDGYSGMALAQWDLTGLEMELDEYGAQVCNDLKNTIPVYQNSWMSLEENFVWVEKATIDAANPNGNQVVSIVGGPVCTALDSRYIQPDGIVEYNPDITSTERFFTVWNISLTVDGITYYGWYPENVADYVWWLFEQGDSDRTHYLYFLQPIGLQAVAKACQDRPAPLLAAGMRVQPVFGGMNIRATPNGALSRTIQATDTVTLAGEAVCVDGAHWWPLQDGGWIAENNPDTQGYVVLLQPAPEAPRQPESQAPSEPDPNPDPPADNRNNVATAPTFPDPQ